LVECRVVKSCCGSLAWLFTVEKPINRGHLNMFRQAGFLLPANFINSGLFYAKKDSFIASASFGLTKINARGSSCEKIRDEFLELLKIVEAS